MSPIEKRVLAYGVLGIVVAIIVIALAHSR